MCVLGPYSDNEETKQFLGFKWDAERHSAIYTSDHINLLIFVDEQKVIAFTEHRRDKGDFLDLHPRCINRDKAALIRRVQSDGGV